MLSATYLAEKFGAGLGYGAYVETGTEEQRRRWGQVYDVARLEAGQREMLGGFGRDMKLLVVSGVWCGDCVQQVPLLQRIVEGNPGRIEMRIVDRDEHRDLADRLAVNGGARVPAVVFMAEDFEFCAAYGDRSLARYRAMARKMLGAACPIGIAAPDRDEVAATLADWLGEVERVQWMLMLSARLQEKHAGGAT